jgi:hypothetical protein
MRLTMICATCGSEDVKLDAWAAWNKDTQAWELSQKFDAGFCEHCRRETQIESSPDQRGIMQCVKDHNHEANPQDCTWRTI